MTHDLWTSLNVHVLQFLGSITLQKLVEDQRANGFSVNERPVVKHPIATTPVVKPIRVTAPNSVFALGNLAAK